MADTNVYFSWTTSGDRFVDFVPLTAADLNDALDEISGGFDAVAAGIDPSAASGTSTTSLTIGTGTKSLTIQTGRALFAGQSVSVAYTTVPATKMLGTVTSYDSATGALVVEVVTTSGSGTYALWTVSLNILSGATLAANTFTAEQNQAKGADIASASTINLTTATGNLVHVTGTTTITAITLASGYDRTVVFDGALTLTHGASLILPGAANIVTAAGDVAIFRGDATATRCVSFRRASTDHEVTVTTGNGFGSTNTKIRRYTTAQRNVGTAITYADSAANGATFTINEAGLYEIYTLDTRTTGGLAFGVSVNSNQLTTSIDSITASHRVAYVNNLTNAEATPVTRVLRLAAGDVVRPHGDGAADSASAVTSVFSIKKICDV